MKRSRCVVNPLGQRSAFGGDAMHGLTLEITLADQQPLRLTPQVSLIPEKPLKRPIGSLAPVSDPNVGALELAITGI